MHWDFLFLFFPPSLESLFSFYEHKLCLLEKLHPYLETVWCLKCQYLNFFLMLHSCKFLTCSLIPIQDD